MNHPPDAYTLQDLGRALRRHRKFALVVGGCVALVGAAIALFTPAEYRAGAAVVVEPARTHLDYAPPPVVAPIEDRLRTVRQVVMGGELLSRVIEEQNLFGELRSDGKHDTAVEKMRRSVEVHAEGETPFTFSVFFRGDDRQMVARVANRLAELFVEQNGEVRVANAGALVAILEDELAGERRTLDAAQDQVVQFKVAHDGELPEQVEGQLRLIAQLGDLEEGYRSSLRSAARRRAMLDSAPPARASELGRALAAEDEVRRTQQALSAEYLPGHPELEQVNRQIEELNRQRVDAEERASKMRYERDELSREIHDSRTALEEARAEARSRKEKIANSARWTAPLAALERNAAAADVRYQAVMRKTIDARVGLRLEERAVGTNFRFIERAAPPDRPHRPNRLQGLLLSLLAGAAAGVAGAFFKDLRDPSVRARAQASRVAPVLAEVPVIKFPSRRSR